MSDVKFKRILVKLSGEAMMGSQGSGIDPQMLDKLAKELSRLHDKGVELGIVVRVRA